MIINYQQLAHFRLIMASKKDVKPKLGLVRLNGSSNDGTLTFKAPRDLSLGSATAKTPEKKKFIPNLNVSRNIKKPVEVKTEKNQENKRKFVKKEKHDQRREKPGLIQTTGSVFAEGMGAGGVIKRRTGGGGGGGHGGGDGDGGGGQTLNFSYNKEEEEKKLKNLMRDDFIDDLKSGDCVPVQLPMIDTGVNIILNIFIRVRNYFRKNIWFSEE